MGAEHYSTDGPVCPHCEHVHNPDDPAFYDDSVDELDCDNCSKPFSVSIYTSTSWTTGVPE